MGKEVEKFVRAVAHAAGDLDGLPDGHAFEIVWRDEEQGEEPRGWFSVGMLRRALAEMAATRPEGAEEPK